MAQSTRVQLEALRDSLIRSGGSGGKTTAEDVRDMVTALIDSLINILDDKDVPDGYAGLDANGHIDVAVINQNASAGQNFARNDGTYSSALLNTLTLSPTGKSHLLLTPVSATPTNDGEIINTGTNVLIKMGVNVNAVLQGRIFNSVGGFSSIDPDNVLQVKDESGNTVNLAIAI
jgi:hypothetical protein